IYVKYDATGQSIKPNQMSQLSKPYPNPASKEVYISYSLSKPQNAVLEVYDIIGKRQYTQAIKNGNVGVVSIPVSQWKDGVYFIQLLADGKIVGTEKIIVKK
ncbi:MAG: T9SS type A sorting domain-containing protein, partial [Bacteroidales bacterium]|nr:T9SS type A sorting domain-containing protein [Bacteroidales bacterium]